MSSTARRRLLRDFRNLQKDPPHGVSGAPVDNNIMKWQAVIFGPDGTIWEGGSFHLELEFSDDYPNKAPKAVFTSRVFHPNVYGDGTVCLDILQNQWSPVYDISAILTSIRSLLCDPNPYSPANNEAAQLYIENRREYNQCVIACVSDSWRTVEENDAKPTSSPSSSSSNHVNTASDINTNNNNTLPSHEAFIPSTVVAQPSASSSSTNSTFSHENHNNNNNDYYNHHPNDNNNTMTVTGTSDQ